MGSTNRRQLLLAEQRIALTPAGLAYLAEQRLLDQRIRLTDEGLADVAELQRERAQSPSDRAEALVTQGEAIVGLMLGTDPTNE